MTSQSPPPSGPSDDAQPPNGSPEGPIDPDATLIRGPLPADPAQSPDETPQADPAEQLDFAEPPAAAESASADGAGSPAGQKLARLVAIVAGAVVVLVGAVYLIGYLMAGDKLPKDAQIAGIAVGGLTTEQAIQQLQGELGDRATAPISVTAGDQKATVQPADAGQVRPEIAEALRAEHQFADHEQGPSLADEVHGVGGRAGVVIASPTVFGHLSYYF